MAPPLASPRQILLRGAPVFVPADLLTGYLALAGPLRLLSQKIADGQRVLEVAYTRPEDAASACQLLHAQRVEGRKVCVHPAEVPTRLLICSPRRFTRTHIEKIIARTVQHRNAFQLTALRTALTKRRVWRCLFYSAALAEAVLRGFSTSTDARRLIIRKLDCFNLFKS